ncbi:hypothetical protein TYRP_018219 [Tyrophagus putrescentiae]|nr:hypothetical protein TYRP_018219 [Tyrophagus putrescentiae]
MDFHLLVIFICLLIPSFTSSQPSKTSTRRKNANSTTTKQPSSTTTTDTPTLITKRVSKRPFYNIAHMVNSLHEIDTYLGKGANGLEADVYFAPNATPVFMFHGHPCDCFRHCAERERVEIYLERVRELSTPSSKAYNPRLVLLFLDLKLLRIAHSAKALAANSPDGSTIRTVISIGHVFDYDFVLGFQNELEGSGRSWLFRHFIGWDVGMNDPLFAIESMWKRFETVHNIWQGDGRSNCLSPFYNLGRLSAIVRKRDSPAIGFGARNLIRKAYQWTVDLTVNIRTALRSNLDAVISNHPERVEHVLREREFAGRYRMATERDSPWDRVLLKASSLKTAAAGAAGTGAGTSGPSGPSSSAQALLQKPSLGLKLVNGAGDMLDSLTKYVGDLLRYRTPVRYYLLSSYTNRRRMYYHHQHQRDDKEEDAKMPPPLNITSSSSPPSSTLFRSVLGQLITALLQRLLQ